MRQLNTVQQKQFQRLNQEYNSRVSSISWCAPIIIDIDYRVVIVCMLRHLSSLDSSWGYHRIYVQKAELVKCHIRLKNANLLPCIYLIARS